MIVLLIEDDADQAKLIAKLLGRAGSHPMELDSVNRLSDGLARLRQGGVDLVLLDLSLPDSSGLATFTTVHAAAPELPIVVMTGLDDDEIATKAMEAGAQDYLVKGRAESVNDLSRVIRRSVERAGTRTKLQKEAEQFRQNEEMVRRLLQSSADCIKTLDLQGRLLWMNECGMKLMDVADFESIRGADWLGLWKGSDHAAAAAAVEAAKRGDTGAFEGFCPTLIGTLKWWSVKINLVADSEGKPDRLLVISRDITQHKQAVDALAEAEQFARSAVDALASHIAILDETGTIIATNEAWRRFATENDGINGRCGVGVDYLAICDRAVGAWSDGAVETAAKLREVLSGRRAGFHLEYPCHSPHEERWFSMQVTRFRGDGPVRVVLAHENITSRKQAEVLQRERTTLKEAVSAMDQVLGVVGHELRTPLAGMRAISEFLLTDGTRSAVQLNRFLTDLSQEVDRMSVTVNNLLEAARLNSGLARWNWSTVSVDACCEDALESIRPLMADAPVELSYSSEPQTLEMRGDAEAIRRLILNLVANSRRHTVAGHIHVSLQRYREDGSDWVEIRVQDTGSGIAPEVLSRLGDAFSLNSGVVGANYITGAGLGMAICKGIVAAHGGTLWIESVLDQGTVVTARVRADLDGPSQGEGLITQVFPSEASSLLCGMEA